MNPDEKIPRNWKYEEEVIVDENNEKTSFISGENFSITKRNSMSFTDPFEYIKELEEQLSQAAQAGLELLSQNSELKESIAKYHHENAQFLEKILLERNANRQKISEVEMEYEAKVQEVLKEAETAKNLSKQNVLNSKLYKDLDEKCTMYKAEISSLKKKLEVLQKVYENSQKELEFEIKKSEQFNINTPLESNTENTINDHALELENTISTHLNTISDLKTRIFELQRVVDKNNDEMKKGDILITQIEKLNKKVDNANNELFNEREIAERAITECKRLSVELLVATEKANSYRDRYETIKECYTDELIRGSNYEENKKVDHAENIISV